MGGTADILLRHDPSIGFCQPTFGKMDPFDIRLVPDQPAYRQIFDQLRERIVSGDLPAGTRIPPIRELASRWKTNYFTVQSGLAPLANEGLISSQPRSGTFVTGPTATLSSVGLYFGVNFWNSDADSFYSALFGILCEQLNQRNIKTRLWIDHRPSGKQNTPWPDLQKAVENREVQGVIATMVTGIDVEWLQNLPVPICLAWEASHPATVCNDKRHLIVTALERFQKCGCKSVGLISSSPSLADIFSTEATNYQLQTAESWIQVLRNSEVCEEAGSRMFKQLWAQDHHPDALLVFPDVLARGVMIAMLEAHLEIPKDLRVIFHMNAELAFYCPFPVDWVVTRATRIASAAIESIENQIAGSRAKMVTIPTELILSEAISARNS
jgi:DNA-binding LacI/PurR family transcriptional regulator